MPHSQDRSKSLKHSLHDFPGACESNHLWICWWHELEQSSGGAIAYFAHSEVGYVAWGIGGLVGFCVQAAADDLDDGFAGMIAAGISVLSILAGKALAAIFLVNWAIQQGQVPGGAIGDHYWTAVGAAFKLSFGVLDIVFFLLAVATAYRIGSNTQDN